MLGKYEEALDLAQDTRAVLRSANLILDQAIVESNIGIIHRRLGQLDQAEEAVLRSLEAFSEVDDVMGQARSHGTLGSIYQTQDRFRKALKHYEIALDGFNSINQTQFSIVTLIYLAILHRREGKPSRALELISQARRLYNELGDDSDIASLTT